MSERIPFEDLMKMTPDQRRDLLVAGQLDTDMLLTAAIDREVFMAASAERVQALGLPENLEKRYTSEEFLAGRFDDLHKQQQQREDFIIGTASAILQETEGTAKEGATIGEKVANAPNLVILDGGPGAGKSFGLGKAVEGIGLDEKREQIVCLGATPTAAADLKGDLTKKDKKTKEPISTPKGGYTVADILKEGTEANQEWNKMMADFEARGIKPVIMVDEAGLLSTEEMAGLLGAVQGKSGKLILAGDSRQIPPSQGSQPFAILAESLKETPAYVNAPYVFRQGFMAEKAITSGIYNGKNNPMKDGCSIDRQLAHDFLKEAVNAGSNSGIKFEFTDRAGQKGGFAEYIAQYKGKNGKTGLEAFVAELSEMAKDVKPDQLNGMLEQGRKAEANTYGKNEEDKEKGIKEGDSKYPIKNEEDLKKYLCAVMICQKMGACAYDALGQVKENQGNDREIYQNVAASYADKGKNGYEELTKKSVSAMAAKQTELDELIKNKASKEEIDRKKDEINDVAGGGFKKGHLTITATAKEAEEANDAIREARFGKDQGLHIGEPLLFKDGTKRLATRQDVDAAKENGGKLPKDCQFAYAMDVKSTQGLSQSGPTDMIVRGETQINWQGGEVLVGASRHKGASDFNILFSSEARKETVFEQSTHQYAAGRNITPPYSEKLHDTAKAFESPAAEQPKTGKAGLHAAIAARSPGIEPAKMSLQGNLSKVSEAQRKQQEAIAGQRAYFEKKNANIH